MGEFGAGDYYNMYGFQSNTGSLHNSFKFTNLPISSLPEQTPLSHVNVQNGRLWAMTARNEMIAKINLEDMEHGHPPLIDQQAIKRKGIRKMFVDSEGVHCLLMAENELFYCNWADDNIHTINTYSVESQGHHNSRSSTLAGSRFRSFQSIDIFHEPGDHEFFQLLVGTRDGQIYHAALEFSPAGLELVEPFSSVLEIPDAKPILDLKIASITFDQNIVLAVTESSLYQFTGENILKSMLLDYKQNPGLITKHQLTLDATIQANDEAR
mmetsp:Transcript_34579/g.52888  ORF Transcript_34579/g.52888 Transcript_34579/m.52888 type:complete len:268 (+) Transcript_34579:218-1021(+)